MRSFVALRTSAHICFISGLFCMVSPFREDWLMFAVLAALVLLTAFLAARRPLARDRILLGLCAALALPLASGIISLLAGLLLVGYAVTILGTGNYGMRLWKYRREVQILLIFCLFFGMFSTIVIFFLSNSSPVFFSLCALQSLLALRAMRLGFGDKLSWELCNPLAFAVPAVAGTAVGVVIWFAKPVIRLIIKPVSLFFTWLIPALAKFLALFGTHVDDTEYTEAVTTTTTGETTETMEMVWEPVKHRDIDLPDVNVPWGWIFGIIGGVAILALLIWLLLRSEKEMQSEKPKEDGAIHVVRSDMSRSRRRRKSRRGRISSNRETIRAIYREYLAFLDKNGIRVYASNTTAEVSDHAQSVLVRSDERLRVLYRLARYSETEPDDGAVEQAKAALAELIARQEAQGQEGTDGQ